MSWLDIRAHERLAFDGRPGARRVRRNAAMIAACSLLIFVPSGRDIRAGDNPKSPPAHTRGTPEVVRFKENPIIRREMLPGPDGASITGPSLIRVPDWVEKPLGKYYLYFAHHHGKYIRLAYADHLAGPWSIYKPGALHLKDVRSVFENSEKPSGPSQDGDSMLQGVNAPDVHVDRDRKEIRMYFGMHLRAASKGSAVAISQDGLHFTPRPELVGRVYFRVVQWRGWHYALDGFGGVSRSRDGLTPFEKIEPGGLGTLASGRKVGRGVKGPLGAIRHAALLVEGDRLSVFFTRYGATPESIMLHRIVLAEDPKHWKVSESVKVLEPEMDYEGADLPLTKSNTGPAFKPVRQLRDPGIYQEGEKTYLLYAVAGESGIAIAEYRDAAE